MNFSFELRVAGLELPQLATRNSKLATPNSKLETQQMAQSRKDFGKWGEEVAVRFLIEKGFTILMRNFRAERGEIDIIAREGDWIVFVEVKTGRSAAFGPPEERITPSKQRQLYKIASHFIQQNPGLEANYRFDAIIVDGSEEQHQIRHYPNAFYLL